MEDNKKKNLTIIIIASFFLFLFVVILFFVVAAGVMFFALNSYEGDYYKIEVGATVQNFSGRYRGLFEVMDKDSNGELSHAEVLDFYNNTVETKKDYSDTFIYEDGKWTVSEGLKAAALEYYTKGRIVTPELNERYGGYFVGINSGVGDK